MSLHDSPGDTLETTTPRPPLPPNSESRGQLAVDHADSCVPTMQLRDIDDLTPHPTLELRCRDGYPAQMQALCLALGSDLLNDVGPCSVEILWTEDDGSSCGMAGMLAAVYIDNGGADELVLVGADPTADDGKDIVAIDIRKITALAA
ncbi:hypothetical protein [Dietzia sp. 179-F 9C3 NHS]|uniref:hypothetical protein n=1 Tax=Dietzia sp. 179-F 9C3 NHS TaxID=3374295 RepID=UPI0038796AB3